jgi:hypothetical protein
MKRAPRAAARAPLTESRSEIRVSHVLKDCFGTVIASLKKMKECVKCELLRECRAINWTEEPPDSPPLVTRRPIAPGGPGGDPAGDPSAGRPSGA